MAVDFTAIFKAQDKVSSTLNSIDKAGSGLDRTFNKLATAAAGVFTAAKVIDFGKQSTKAFISFEDGMNETFTLLPNITERAMDAMSEQVKQVSIDMKRLPEETVPALYQALSAGVSQDNVFNFLEDANKAAVGGITELETAVDGLSTIVNSYGADVIDSAKASDLMFTTVRLGKTTFEELSSSLFNVLPSASAAGVGFEDVSASLAALTAQGVPTSVATTRVRSVIDELSKSGTKTDKVFRKVAGKGFKDFIKQGGNLQEALQVLEKEAAKNNLGINDLFGSIEAGGAALGLTGKGTEAFTKALNEMENATGATDSAFAKMEKGFQRKIDGMKARLEVLKINIGGALVDAFNFLWDKASPILKNITEGFNQLKDLFSNLGFSGAIEQLFGADAGAIAKIGEDYALSLFSGIKKIFSGDIQGGFGDILGLMGFDEKSIDGIMVFVDSIKEGFLELSGFIKPVFDSISGTIETIMPTIQDVLNYFTQKLIPTATDVFNFLKDKVIGPLVDFWTTNIPKLANIFNNMWLILEPIFNFLYGAFKMILAVAKPIIANVIDLVTGLATSIWSILDGIIQFIAGIFTGDWEKAWGGVKKIFAGIWEGIASALKFPINLMIDSLNFFLQGLNKIKIPDWVPVVGGKGFNIPEIPMFAKGTKNSPDTFIAGEEGPELITGAAGKRIFPSDDTDRIISAMERQNQPIQVSANPFNTYDEPSMTQEEKTINIKINGEGAIQGKGLSVDQLYDYLIVHLKPILLSILETEVFEEGDLSYEF